MKKQAKIFLLFVALVMCYTRSNAQALKGRLGQLEGNTATVQQIYDNAQTGIVVLPENKRCEVVSYEFTVIPKTGESSTTELVKGNKVPLASQKYLGYKRQTGVKYAFNKIFAKCQGSDKPQRVLSFDIISQ